MPEPFLFLACLSAVEQTYSLASVSNFSYFIFTTRFPFIYPTFLQVMLDLDVMSSRKKTSRKEEGRRETR
jgi:hypothetical protein